MQAFEDLREEATALLLCWRLQSYRLADHVGAPQKRVVVDGRLEGRGGYKGKGEGQSVVAETQCS